MFDILSDGRDWAVVRKAKEAQKKHTLKQVIEWGNEPCPHLATLSDGLPAAKRHCYQCWAELAKEVENGY